MTATASQWSNGAIPAWRFCDRLSRSLNHANIPVQSMANYLEVSRNTVGGWLNGHHKPSPASLRVWAMLTGVDYDWLKDGTAPVEMTGAVPCAKCAARDSNPEPADLEPGRRRLAIAGKGSIFDRQLPALVERVAA